MSKIDSIRFRMYDTGSVGDCLLLLFESNREVKFSMMIDCGGWNTSPAKISPCVEDIRRTCGGHLDLLVVTHQHLDHVSGFNQARAVFDQIKVKEVWMSWIENKNDAIARILKEKFGKKLKQLKQDTEKALKLLKVRSGRSVNVRGFGERIQRKQARMENTLRLIEFEMGFERGMAAKSARPTNEEAIDYVKKKGSIKYRKPGQVIELPGLAGVRFYMLGPPRDADMKFFKIAMKEEEMYHLALKSATSETEMPEEDGIRETGINLEDGISPFNEEFKLSGKDKTEFNKKYNSADYRWRQIESDWLETAASIAMRATRLTNNTSLAMAIEFSESGRVVLLPGDAQSGNWMGWHKPDISKKLKDDGGKTTVELLNNTVFYKVGHHGSHNGTASISGLEHMKSPDLVAMMPLVQASVPEEWGGADNFPAKALYKVLIEKTKGRLIRTDQGVVTAALAKKMRSQMTKEEKSAFEKGFVKGKSFIEYLVKG